MKTKFDMSHPKGCVCWVCKRPVNLNNDYKETKDERLKQPERNRKTNCGCGKKNVSVKRKCVCDVQCSK